MSADTVERLSKVVLCLLVRNERPCLEVIVPQLPKPGAGSGFDEIIAIDGASTDGLVEFLQDAGIPVIAQSRRGRGDAFLKAFADHPSDAYVFFSPDGNEAIADLGRFRPLLEAGADLVIASRMMAGAVNEEDAQLLRPRKWVNNLFTLGVNLVFRRSGPYITDAINGYRAITREAAKRLELDALDYTIEFQMTMRALAQRMTIVEFPTHEGARIAGETGAPSLPTGLRFIGCFWRETLRLCRRRRPAG
jgi:glycosyltransferase involved in cell wall biosynthesis